jgi:hydroxypyruvate isomerase
VLAAQRHAIAAALKRAAPLAEAAGVVLMQEPLNILVDHTGYCLSCSGDGAEVLREVGSPVVKLLFDIYHMQIAEGNLIGHLAANADLLAAIRSTARMIERANGAGAQSSGSAAPVRRRRS